MRASHGAVSAALRRSCETPLRRRSVRSTPSVPPDLSGQWYRGGGAAYYHELFVDPSSAGHDLLEWIPTSIGAATAARRWSTTGWEDTGDARRSPRGRRSIPRTGTTSWLATTAACTSLRQGATFRFFTNLPVTQYYRVSVDNAKPFYNVCGARRTTGRSAVRRARPTAGAYATATGIIVGGGDGFQTRTDPGGSRTSSTRVAGRQPHAAAISAPGSVRVDPAARSFGAAGARTPGADSLGRRGAGQRGGSPQGGDRRRLPGPQGGPPQGGRGAAARGDRANWDAPYIISPHSPRAALLGEQVSSTGPTTAATPGRASART